MSIKSIGEYMEFSLKGGGPPGKTAVLRRPTPPPQRSGRSGSAGPTGSTGSQVQELELVGTRLNFELAAWRWWTICLVVSC